MSKCVVIFSGGMDSTVILQHCIRKYDQVHCLTYDYNQRHKAEIDRALDYTTSINQDNIVHTIVDLGFYSKLASASALTNSDIAVPDMKDVIGDPQCVTYVPNRNMVMLSVAAGYAESIEATDVYYGAALADDTSGYWDCTTEFLLSCNNILKLNRRNTITIFAPLIAMTKAEIIRYGIELGVDYSKTLTCYSGLDKACGKCPSCAARLKGFIDAGIKDPLEYALDIPWEKYNCKDIK
jgi:7-cyano-7-deazaguanine synthase